MWTQKWAVAVQTKFPQVLQVRFKQTNKQTIQPGQSDLLFFFNFFAANFS